MTSLRINYDDIDCLEIVRQSSKSIEKMDHACTCMHFDSESAHVLQMT